MFHTPFLNYFSRIAVSLRHVYGITASDYYGDSVALQDIQALTAITYNGKRSCLGYPRLGLSVRACHVVGYDVRHFPLIAAGQYGSCLTSYMTFHLDARSQSDS